MRTTQLFRKNSSNCTVYLLLGHNLQHC